MTIQRTLSIIKPDAVAKNVIGQIISRFESNGLKIIEGQLLQLSRSQAEDFYKEHIGKPFFEKSTFLKKIGFKTALGPILGRFGWPKGVQGEAFGDLSWANKVLRSRLGRS